MGNMGMQREKGVKSIRSVTGYDVYGIGHSKKPRAAIMRYKGMLLLVSNHNARSCRIAVGVNVDERWSCCSPRNINGGLCKTHS